MKIKICRLLLAAGVALPAMGAELPDLERGRLLYENHCLVCHSSKVHGRPNRLPLNTTELKAIVAGWAKEQRLDWSEEEIRDVAEYLDRTYYRFQR